MVAVSECYRAMDFLKPGYPSQICRIIIIPEYIKFSKAKFSPALLLILCKLQTLLQQQTRFHS